MDPPSSRMINYYYRLSPCQQQQQKPLPNLKPTDLFKFKVTATLRYLSTNPNSHPRIIITSSLFETSITISCKRLFGINHQDLLRRYLPNSYSSLLTYFSPQCLDQISQKIIPELQQMFYQHSHISDPKISDSDYQVFHLALNIVVDVPRDDEIEESSMQDVKMVPASNEAIQSLKTYELPEQCQICMEKFHGENGKGDDDNVEITPMPCGHVFHHKCIVQWLQTSHMCPMCLLFVHGQMNEMILELKYDRH